MEQRSPVRTIAIIAVTVLAVWLLIPSYYSFFVLPREQRNDIKALEALLPAWSPPAKYRLSLGLDLQGGIHMVMRVDTRTALQKRTERRGLQIANFLRDQNVGEVTPDADPEQLQLTLTAADPTKADAIKASVLENFTDFNLVRHEGSTIVLQLRDRELDRFRLEAVDQAMIVIRRRIDKWGVAEVDVRKLGSDSIQISLPGQQNPEQAKELVGTTAQLEFRLVDHQSNLFRELQMSQPPPPSAGISITESDGYPQLQGPDREALLAYVKDRIPADREVLVECIPSPVKKTECASYKTYLVEKNVPLTGDSIIGAEANISQFNEPEVNLSFDAQGGRDFGNLTGNNVGRFMAIVLDDTVQSAPRINEKIPNGRARISMGRPGGKTLEESLQEAQTLALVLKAGALPAPVSTGEIRQVGASLGDELIKKGAYSAALGLFLVLVFIAFYYRVSGLIADVALLLNGLLILAGLAAFNATLTLPGIAGFVLTLGIAVDSNVLINERIREELSHGKTPRAAVDAGYDRVFWTIFDANITTLFAGVILFFMGTGPIRGFATSLIIGIIASMFTSIVVTRAIVTRVVHGRNAQTVSI